MDSHSSRAARAAVRIVRAIAAAALAVTCFSSLAHAQTQPPAARSGGENLFPVRQTVFLENVTDLRQLNDIQTDLRNVFPRMKIYGIASQLAITMAGTAEDVDAGKSLIAELDRPARTYRITYTFTEIDNGNRSGAHRYVLIAAAGERTELVEGTKVPVVVAAADKPGAPAQFQYVDVGLKIRATPKSMANGLRLESSVEQSSVAGEKPMGGIQEPTLNQTALNATANLAEGKPQVLGSMDVPGTAKRLEISVTAEAAQ